MHISLIFKECKRDARSKHIPGTLCLEERHAFQIAQSDQSDAFSRAISPFWSARECAKQEDFFLRSHVLTLHFAPHFHHYFTCSVCNSPLPFTSISLMPTQRTRFVYFDQKCYRWFDLADLSLVASHSISDNNTITAFFLKYAPSTIASSTNLPPCRRFQVS